MHSIPFIALQLSVCYKIFTVFNDKKKEWMKNGIWDPFSVCTTYIVNGI